MKYTNSEVQQIIDDLDYAKAFFSDSGEKEMKQVHRSLENASDLFTDISVDVFEGIDKRREIFIK